MFKIVIKHEKIRNFRGNLNENLSKIDKKKIWSMFEECKLPDYDPLASEIFDVVLSFDNF